MMARFTSSVRVILLFTLARACHASPLHRRDSVDSLVGFATLNGGTTGGNGIPVLVVTTFAALKSALADDVPRYVRISGVIAGSGAGVPVGSNKTIFGTCGSGLRNSGFIIEDKRNVIIRNLKIFQAPEVVDLILIQGSQNVWIDHNELYTDLDHAEEYYGGAITVRNASDFITVSWNKIHDHRVVSQVGHSDSNSAEDMGHLKVTYHHNHYLNVVERTPWVRFGQVHIYNNVFENVEGTAISLSESAQAIIEKNIAVNSGTPLVVAPGTHHYLMGNSWTLPASNPGSFYPAPYPYLADSLTIIQSYVTTYAGVCIVTPPAP